MVAAGVPLIVSLRIAVVVFGESVDVTLNVSLRPSVMVVMEGMSTLLIVSLSVADTVIWDVALIVRLRITLVVMESIDVSLIVILRIAVVLVPEGKGVELIA